MTVDRRALLADVPLLAGLDGPTLDRIAAAPARSVQGGRTLFRQGQQGDAAYVVLSGRLAAVATDREGRELVLRVLGPSELFGEMALLDGGPRSATVRALDDSTVLVLHRVELRDLLRRRPELALSLLSELSARLRQASAALGDSAHLELHARLARTLLDLVRRFGRETDDGVHVELRLSQQALAEMVGVTRESVNKHLRRWAASGVLSHRRGWLTVHDPDALRISARFPPL